jgi:tetratricopeptide (TPR) repeat protein
MAITLNNIGETYFQMGDFQNAKKHLEEAIKINTELGFDAQLSNSLFNLGRLYMHGGNYKNAEKYFKACLKTDIQNSIEDNTSLYEQFICTV